MNFAALTASILYFLCLGSHGVFAQDSDLGKLLQNEYGYVSSQKEALKRQKSQLEHNFQVRKNSLTAQIHQLQKNLVNSTSENDERMEKLTALEKQQKDFERRNHSLEATYKRARAILTENERALQFESTVKRPEEIVPDELTADEFQKVFSRADQLLQAAATRETFQTQIFNDQGRLVDGKVTRLGRVAAFAQLQDDRFYLGPTGSGALKTLDQASGDKLFLFDSLTDSARLLKPTSWIERLADLSPVLFLALMLGLVGGLFFILAKI